MSTDSQRAASDVRYEFDRLGMKVKFVYSIIGILLGLACIFAGAILGLYGVVGHTNLTASLLGLSTNLTDAGPGVVVLVIGIFMVWFTKFKVTDVREVRARDAVSKEISPSPPSDTRPTPATAGPILPVAVASMPVAASARSASQSTLTQVASAPVWSQSPSVFGDQLREMFCSRPISEYREGLAYCEHSGLAYELAAAPQDERARLDRIGALTRRVDRLEALAREEQERIDRLPHRIWDSSSRGTMRAFRSIRHSRDNHGL